MHREFGRGQAFSSVFDRRRDSLGKARDNIRVIELVRQIEAEGRPATADEQAELALYVGWGGLKGNVENAANRLDGALAACNPCVIAHGCCESISRSIGRILRKPCG